MFNEELHKTYRTGIIVSDGRKQHKCKRNSDCGANHREYPPAFLRTLQEPRFMSHVHTPWENVNTALVRRHGLDENGELQLKGRHG